MLPGDAHELASRVLDAYGRDGRGHGRGREALARGARGTRAVDVERLHAEHVPCRWQELTRLELVTCARARVQVRELQLMLLLLLNAAL